jgi:hypothetical protein
MLHSVVTGGASSELPEKNYVNDNQLFAAMSNKNMNRHSLFF